MPRRHAAAAWLAAYLALAHAAGAGAQEDADAAPDAPPEPELDFLEYLGSWPVDDEEWLLMIEWEPDTPDTEENTPEQPPEDEGES